MLAYNPDKWSCNSIWIYYIPNWGWLISHGVLWITKTYGPPPFSSPASLPQWLLMWIGVYLCSSLHGYVLFAQVWVGRWVKWTAEDGSLFMLWGLSWFFFSLNGSSSTQTAVHKAEAEARAARGGAQSGFVAALSLGVWGGLYLRWAMWLGLQSRIRIFQDKDMGKRFLREGITCTKDDDLRDLNV